MSESRGDELQRIPIVVLGAGGVGGDEVPAFAHALGLPRILAAQAGLLDDLDLAADALYGRNRDGAAV